MLQNFLYLYKKKTKVVFFVLHFEELVIDKGIHKIKMKVAEKEKRKKLHGFSFYIDVANFEAVLRNLNLSANRLFCSRDNHLILPWNFHMKS